MVGTAMFFSKPGEDAERDALLSTGDYDLINTSRIKLIGQKAKLVEKPGNKRKRQADGDVTTPIFVPDEDTSVVKGKSLGEIRTSNAKINADIKGQAAFLEKLMDVKRAKGESTNVRTVFTQKRPANSIIFHPRGLDTTRSRENQTFPTTADEIEELNRRVVRGDANALMRLQDIYATMEEKNNAAAATSTGRNLEQLIPAENTSQAPTAGPATDANVLEQEQAAEKHQDTGG
jgi:hypothetical protein